MALQHSLHSLRTRRMRLQPVCANLAARCSGAWNSSKQSTWAQLRTFESPHKNFAWWAVTRRTSPTTELWKLGGGPLLRDGCLHGTILIRYKNYYHDYTTSGKKKNAEGRPMRKATEVYAQCFSLSFHKKKKCLSPQCLALHSLAQNVKCFDQLAVGYDWQVQIDIVVHKNGPNSTSWIIQPQF